MRRDVTNKPMVSPVCVCVCVDGRTFRKVTIAEEFGFMTISVYDKNLTHFFSKSEIVP